MKKTIKAGLTMALAALTLMGCTSEGAMNPSQVEYQNVNIRFFDSTLEQMGVPQTRGDETALGDNFKRLDVALFQEGDAQAKYTVTQSSDEDNFGTVNVRVPTGSYTLLGVAHKSIAASTPSANIESLEKVTFSGNVVGDVAYVKQTIDVNTINPTATACPLKRAVALFRIKCKDAIPDDAKNIKISFDKNCSFKFNPTTGFSIGAAPYLTYSVNKSADEAKTDREFNVYLFLADDKINTNVSVTVLDGENNVLNTMTFSDVTLEINHITTYTGKFFTAGEDLTFSFSQGDFTPSEYDLAF